MKHFGYIYKIINLINNKIYIGKTEKTIEKRFHEHIKKSLVYDNKIDNQSHLYSAMQRYGINNFKVEEIDVADSKDELNEKEKYWIKFFNSTDNFLGYNIASGGAGGNVLEGYTEDEYIEYIQRISNRVPWNKGLNKDEQKKYTKKELKKKINRKDGWTEEKRKHHGELVSNGIKKSQSLLTPEMKQLSHNRRSESAKTRAKTQKFKDMLYKHNKDNKWGAKPVRCIYNNCIYNFCTLNEAGEWLKALSVEICREYSETLRNKRVCYYINKIRSYIKSDNTRFVIYHKPGNQFKVYIDNMIWEQIQKIN